MPVTRGKPKLLEVAGPNVVNPFARAVPKLLALFGKIYQRGPRNALIF